MTKTKAKKCKIRTIYVMTSLIMSLIDCKTVKIKVFLKLLLKNSAFFLKFCDI